MRIPFVLLSKNGKCPTQANKGDAGYDLYAAENKVIYPSEKELIRTDIAIQIPEGYYGRIAPRSGLAHKYGLDIFAGVVDSSYRGNIGVILYNSKTNYFYKVKKGERIAQLIIEKCHDIKWVKTDNIENSGREDSGFGSSGK